MYANGQQYESAQGDHYIITGKSSRDIHIRVLIENAPESENPQSTQKGSLSRNLCKKSAGTFSRFKIF
jgi:hypothetical protein